MGGFRTGCRPTYDWDVIRAEWERGDAVSEIIRRHGMTTSGGASTVSAMASRREWNAPVSRQRSNSAQARASRVKHLALEAQKLLDAGELSEAVARNIGVSPNTVREWAKKGMVTPKYLRNTLEPLGETVICRSCGVAKPVTQCIVVTHGRGKPVREPYVARCKACQVAMKRDLRRRKGARPYEEYIAGGIKRRALRAMLVDLRKALQSSVRASLQEEAAQQGVSVDAIKYRRRYREDSAFRAREIERVHRRNAKRDHDIEMLSDGSLTGEVVGRLFAAASTCHYCSCEMSRNDKSLDHVVPVRQGGLHSIENVVIACRRCNTAKAGRTPDQWRHGVRMHRESGSGLRSQRANAQCERS